MSYVRTVSRENAGLQALTKTMHAPHVPTFSKPSEAIYTVFQKFPRCGSNRVGLRKQA